MVHKKIYSIDYDEVEVALLRGLDCLDPGRAGSWHSTEAIAAASALEDVDEAHSFLSWLNLCGYVVSHGLSPVDERYYWSRNWEAPLPFLN